MMAKLTPLTEVSKYAKDQKAKAILHICLRLTKYKHCPHSTLRTHTYPYVDIISSIRAVHMQHEKHKLFIKFTNLFISRNRKGEQMFKQQTNTCTYIHNYICACNSADHTSKSCHPSTHIPTYPHTHIQLLLAEKGQKTPT